LFILDDKKILVVDDYKENLDILVESLIDKYQIFVAKNGLDAIEVAKKVNPDLILMDIMMPIMNGYDALKHLKADSSTQDIPVILVSTLSEVRDKKKGFDLGAVDYITKPFEMMEVAYRVNIHLNLREAAKFLESQNRILEEKVLKRTKDNENLRDAMIETLAALAETRDSDTGNHIRRTQHYIIALAKSLKALGYSKDIITDNFINLLFKTTPLHDVGKVGIPDRILLKPGKLTDEEFEIMKTHAYIGYKSLKSADILSDNESFIELAAETAYTHHEKWDGSGYPRGLIGESIPLSGRLMAVVDVYDALVSKRIYKESMSHEQAVKIILGCSGTHFQPEIVEAFIAAEDEFLHIKSKFEE